MATRKKRGGASKKTSKTSASSSASPRSLPRGGRAPKKTPRGRVGKKPARPRARPLSAREPRRQKTKKAISKKIAAKKAPKKKAPIRRAPAKKVVAKKRVAKKRVAEKTVAKKRVVKKAPAKKAPAKKAPAKKAPAKKAPARRPVPAKKAPAKKASKRARHATRADQRDAKIRAASAAVDKALASLRKLLDSMSEKRRAKYESKIPAPIIGRPTQAKIEARFQAIRAAAEKILHAEEAAQARRREARERAEKEAEEKRKAAAERARERREAEAKRKEKKPTKKAKEKPASERLMPLLKNFGRPAFEPSVHVFKRTQNVHVFVNVPIPYGLRDTIEDIDYVGVGAETVMYPQVYEMRNFRVWFRISLRMTVLRGYEDNYKKLKGQEAIIGSWRRGDDFPEEWLWARETAMPNVFECGHELTSFVVEAWYGKTEPDF